jgi:hypothetical protein
MAWRSIIENQTDRVQPRGVGRGEVHLDARVVIQPIRDVGIFVRGLVVHY